MASTKPKSKTSSDDPLKRYYKTNFLTGVIARIDFGLPIQLPEGRIPSIVLKHTNSIFPILEHDVEVETIIALGSPPTPPPKPAPPKSVFKLWSQDRQKACTITHDFMAVEYKQYHSFSVLTSDFNAVLKPLATRFKLLKSKRLGLRYINTIDLKDDSNLFEWSSYLSDALLSGFTISDPSNLTRSFNVTERAHGEFRSKLQFGMINPDYPAIIKRKMFVIDMDHVNENLLDPTAIRQKLPMLHDASKLLFESIIKDDLRKLMNSKNA